MTLAMPKQVWALLFCTPCVGLAWGQVGQDEAPSPPVIAAPASDRDNHRGDAFILQVATAARSFSFVSGNSKPVCVPARAKLRRGKDIQQDGRTYASFVVESTPANARCALLGGVADMVDAKPGDLVTMAPGQFDVIPKDRHGLTYGTLLVPFKYHFRGSKNLSGGTSLGGYLGWRVDRARLGIAIQTVAFMGATMIEVTKSVDGQAKTENLAGLSAGLGFIGTVKDDFQLGIVLGWDRINKNTDYKDNGKPWLAVSLGFSFSN